MGDMTINQLATDLTLIAGIIAALMSMYAIAKKWFTKVFAAQTKSILQRINDLENKIEQNGNEACKNYLVHYLSSVERGIIVDHVETERFYEEYDYYIKHGGNSYVKAKVDKLKKEGKL